MQIQGQMLLNEIMDNLRGFLSRPTVSVDQLMKRQEVQNEIRQQSKFFSKFCMEHEQFCFELIDKAFLKNIFSSPQQKEISSKCNEIMCSPNQNIIRIFVNNQKHIESNNQEETVKQEQNQKQIQQTSEKYKYLLYLFRYIKQDQKNINNTSLCEIIKLLNNIMQNQASDLFNFFKKNPECLQQFIDLSFIFAGVSDMLGKFVAEEVPTFRELKQQIIERIIVNMKNTDLMKTQDYIFLLDFVQLLFSRNRFRNQDSDEIISVTQRLVDGDVIQFFILKVLSSIDQEANEESDLILYNCLQYLLLLCERVNADDESSPLVKTLEKPTMDFQLSSIIKNYEILLTKSLSNSYRNITKLSFYEFLLKINKNRYFAEIKFQAIQTAIHFLKIFKCQNTNGMIKIYILELIEYCVDKIDEINSTQVLKIASALGPIQNFIKTKECLGLICKIIILLTNKNEIFFSHYKSINIQDIIKTFVDTVGADLIVIQRKKFKPKQLCFLDKYREQFFKMEATKMKSEVEHSDSDNEMESCFPKTPAGNREISWTEDKNFFISKQSSQNQVDQETPLQESSEQEDNGILLLESGNLADRNRTQQ